MPLLRGYNIGATNLMKSNPKFTYCGLTVVLSNPSRFDKADLLTANGNTFFSEMCLRPEYNRYQCEVRTADDRSALLPGTKCVLLLGSCAMSEWLGPQAKDNSLGELRGSTFIVNDLPHIVSYFPQDCVDSVDLEKQHNPLSEHYADPEFDEDDDGEGSDDKRRHGFTKHKNFGFWLMMDCKKVKYILKNGHVPTEPKPEYVIYPSIEDIVHLLSTTKNEYFYFDIETDIDLNIFCFSFSFSSSIVYVVPTLLPDYSHAYSELWRIYKALAICVRDNITVAHNGSNFDFFVLAYKYHIPIGRRVYDTMIAQHRCYPEIEKSLGHCTSLWTWQTFHKDMGDVPYNSLDNARRTWQYCGLDVFTMALIREAIDKYAARNPGLRESIDAANGAIRPYLITSLLGIRFDEQKLKQTLTDNDYLMNKYLSWIEYLVGPENLKQIRGKSKSALPSSNPQCCKYFHGALGYPIIGKGKEKTDGTRSPSLGKKNMFKLRLKHENPVIDLILAYREVSKESGSLKFTPYALS